MQYQRVLQGLNVVFDFARRHTRIIAYFRVVDLLSIEVSGKIEKSGGVLDRVCQGFCLNFLARVRASVSSQRFPVNGRADYARQPTALKEVVDSLKANLGAGERVQLKEQR